MKINKLRKQVKKLMVDAGLDARGGQKIIAEALNIHRSSLNNALSGYREGLGAILLLNEVKKHLKSELTQGQSVGK